MIRAVPLLRLDPGCPIEWGHPLNRGLVSEWTVTPLSGWSWGLTLRDLVRGGKSPNDGTLTNGPLWQGASGRPGGYGALSLNGTTSYVKMGLPSSLQLTYPLTICGWVYLRSAQSFDFLFGVAGVYDTGNPAYALGIQGTSLTWYTGGGNGSFALTVPTGKWVFVALTADANTKTGYLDTAKDVVSSFTSAPVYTSREFQISSWTPGSYTDGFDGLVDGVMVWNRILPASEVLAVYDQSRRGNPERWNWVSSRDFSLPALPRPTGSAKRTEPLLRLDPGCPVNWGHPLSRGLVANWAVTPLSGWSRGETLRDLVRGGKSPNDGTLTNGPTWAGAQGRPGGYGALSLDGSNDYIDIASGLSSLNGAGEGTFSCWLYPTSFSGYGDPIRTYPTSPFLGVNCFIDKTAGGDGGPGVPNMFWGNVTVFRGGTALTLSTWTLLTVTVSTLAGEVRFYLNGKLDQTRSGITAGPSGVTGARLGNHTNGTEPYAGLMDDVALWTRVLSASEVLSVYDQSRRGNPDRWNWLSGRDYSFAPSAVTASVLGKFVNINQAVKTAVY